MSKYHRCKALVGQKVRYDYPAPAITCENNGARITGEGRVLRVGRTPYLGLCLVILNQSGAERYVRRSEVQLVDDRAKATR